MLKMEKVTKSFGKVQALDGVDLHVQPGEIYGFIGPNGAGKTTAIRVLMGFIRPDSGHCTIFGRNVWKEAVQIHQRVAYVPGDVNLWPNLTGGEVIDLFLRLQSQKDVKARDYWMERFDLDPTKKCRTYSKGNRQKVALVAAFAQEADLYILDEPTSGLDPLMEKVFQEGLRERKKEGKSVLLSSHILSEVEKLCDRVSIIRRGKIIETGSMKELRHLTHMDVHVRTLQPLPDQFGSAYITDLREEEGEIHLRIDSAQIGRLMEEITPYGIESLQCMPPTLETLFMRHYQEEG